MQLQTKQGDINWENGNLNHNKNHANQNYQAFQSYIQAQQKEIDSIDQEIENAKLPTILSPQPQIYKNKQHQYIPMNNQEYDSQNTIPTQYDSSKQNLYKVKPKKAVRYKPITNRQQISKSQNMYENPNFNHYQNNQIQQNQNQQQYQQQLINNKYQQNNLDIIQEQTTGIFQQQKRKQTFNSNERQSSIIKNKDVARRNYQSMENIQNNQVIANKNNIFSANQYQNNLRATRNLNYNNIQQPQQQNQTKNQKVKFDIQQNNKQSYSPNPPSILKNKYKQSSSVEPVQAPQFSQEQVDNLISQLPKFRELQIVKIPNDDKIQIQEFTDQNDKNLDKYVEFMNNDNDIYYLESSFSDFYQHILQQKAEMEGGKVTQSDFRSLNLTSNSNSSQYTNKFSFGHGSHISGKSGGGNLLGNSSMHVQNLLSVCFEDPHNQTKQGKHMHLHPQYRKTIKSLNNNPLLTGQNTGFGGFNTQNRTNMDISSDRFKVQTPISNSKSENYAFNSSNQSKVNSTFFNRKFTNVPQIEKEKLQESLFKPYQKVANIFIYTKFKVKIDIGFMQFQFSQNMKNQICYLNKLYISRIYRKLHYHNFICLFAYMFIFENYPNVERIQVHVNNKCQEYIKFLYQVGFKLEFEKGEKEKQIKQKFLMVKRQDFYIILNEVQKKFF